VNTNDTPLKPQSAAVPPSDDSSLTHLQRTMLTVYADSSPEFLDQIRSLKLKPSPTRTMEQLPPRVQAIVSQTMGGMTGDIHADLLRVRYSLMLIFGESDFGDDAHQRRSLKWRAGIVPSMNGGQL
jgi:hypothetical protein